MTSTASHASHSNEASPETLTTFAPTEVPESLHPTGNLLVALPEIDDRGWCHSINVVHEGQRGLVAAEAPEGAMLRPLVTIDGGVIDQPELKWSRDGHWIPRAIGSTDTGRLEIVYLVPVKEQGVVARLSWTNTGSEPQHAELGWTGAWEALQVHHFRAKRISVGLREREDPWTGARTVYAGSDRLLLSISWRAGEGAAHGGHPDHGWLTSRSGRVGPGETIVLDVYVGVGTEPDGSGGTALHLRRRGFEALHAETLGWLADRALVTGASDVDARIALNQFFNYFFAQADCVDTGRSVMLTSRSPRYYVCAAFWSRDAYWWSFPAIVLTDARRARHILVASIGTAGENIAHHALYITGTKIYPGFELDELTTPMLAIWRYVDATGDRSVLDEPAIIAYFAHFRRELAEWFNPELGLYGTMLLPTDDPTDFPYVTTDNATVALGFRILAALTGSSLEPALAVEAALRERNIMPDGRWAWAVDATGAFEEREEPPLSLRVLPYFGVDEPEASAATAHWLVTDYAYHYPGPFPGAGAPHFASPSSFDLGNRMLTGNHDLGDPLRQLVETPMDNGIACESWDPETGEVATGAAMASAAGYIAWSAWANHIGHTRWDDPFSRDSRES